MVERGIPIDSWCYFLFDKFISNETPFIVHLFFVPRFLCVQESNFELGIFIIQIT